MITANDLLPGDLLFIRKGQNNIIHILMCVKSAGNYLGVKVVHTVGQSEPYAFI